MTTMGIRCNKLRRRREMKNGCDQVRRINKMERGHHGASVWNDIKFRVCHFILLFLFLKVI